MKNKKKILSLIACLSLLSSCNRGTSSNSSCSITASTPTSSVTPEPEQINIFDYAITSTITSTNDSLLYQTLSISGFNDELTDEMKLKVEEITIPEEINGVKLTRLFNTYGGLFKGFNNLKKIKLSKNILQIESSGSFTDGVFINLPSLQSIEVDSENEYYYTKGNCLIHKGYSLVNNNRILNGTYRIRAGWKDIEIPDEVTSIYTYSITGNSSITSIKLNKTINNLNQLTFRYLDNLKSIDLNGNENYVIAGTNCLFTKNMDNLITAWGDAKIPDNVTSLNYSNNTNNYGLSYTNIQSIDLNNCVEIKTDQLPFRKCNNLRKIIFSSKMTIDNLDHNTLRYISNLKSISFNGDNQNLKIESFSSNNQVIGQALYSIDESKLFGGWGDIKLSSNVIFNGQYNLSHHNSFTSVVLPSTLDLTNNISASIYYFIEMENIKSIFFEEGSKYKTDGYFIIDTTTNAIVNCFGYSNFNNQDLVIPEGVEVINSNFVNFKNITGIVFPSTLKRIEIKCTNYYGGGLLGVDQSRPIVELNIPKNVEYIDNNCFKNLVSIKAVNIDNENKYLKCENGMIIINETNEMVFAFGDVDLSNMTEINNISISNFYSVVSLRFSKNLTSINLKSANNNNLSTVYFDGNESEFKSCANGNLYTTCTKFRKDVNVVFSDGTSKSIADIN